MTTITCTVTDAAGASASTTATATISAANDGSAGAPGGTPQHAGMLSGYKVRPPWNVSGIDYAVGIKPGTVLKDPLPGGVLAPGLVALGGSVDAFHHIVIQGVNNAVIDGWDFSLHGGYRLDLGGDGPDTLNITVQNCNFKCGSLLKPAIWANNVSGITIQNCVIDGAGVNINDQPGAPVNVGGSGGNRLYQYNWFKNAYYQHVQDGPPPNGVLPSQVVQFNVFENSGLGWALTQAHGDWIQDFSSFGGSPAPVFDDIEVNYNLFIQNSPQGNTQGLSLCTAGGDTANVLKIGASNNTIICPAGSFTNFAIIIDTTRLNGSATVNNNYVDPSSIGGAWLFFGDFGAGGPFHGTLASKVGNTNLVDGTGLT